MDVALALQAIAGVVVLAWLPGYAWTRVAMPRLRPMERFPLSVALSVALVTLAVVGGDLLFGIRVSGRNAVVMALAIAAIAMLPAGLRLLRRLVARRSQKRAPEEASPTSPGPLR